jgi:acetyl esterase/lipase
MELLADQLILRTERYGSLEDQVGDLFLPARPRPPVVCLLHGGFWRMPYGRDQMTAIAQDLANRGYAVWNLEYRRLGSPTGGWPGTCDDVISGIEYLTSLTNDGIDLDLKRVVIIGHSAGGHLALWSTAQQQGNRNSKVTHRILIKAVVGEAPVADLKCAYEMGVGGGAVAELLGATLTDQPRLYYAASPITLLPLGVPQFIIHGTADNVVPIEISYAYTNAARAAGDQIELLELSGVGHMEFLDPSSAAHHAVCDWLVRILGGSSSE